MNYCFAADRTLGKLVKWLRILGFDTLFESDVGSQWFYQHLEPERVLLTRIEKNRSRFADRRPVFIEADDVSGQLRQVVEAVGIAREDVRLFSICLQCNAPIIEVDKQIICGLVPDYIWETHDEFHRCRKCERIFWAGSHTQRSMELVKQLFEQHCP